MIKVTPRITVSGLMRRQALYHSIECRGILVNEERLAECRAYVDAEINKQLQIASKAWGKVLYVGVDNAPSYKLKEAIATGAISAEDAQLAIDNSFNIRSPEKFLAFLKDYGYKVPKATKKTVDGEWESKEGTSELILREMIMTNQFGSVNGDEALIAVLNVRELITLRSRYINARLFPRPEGPVYLSLYNAGSGTLTGRRNSKKHLYGYGGYSNTKSAKYRQPSKHCWLVFVAGSVTFTGSIFAAPVVLLGGHDVIAPGVGHEGPPVVDHQQGSRRSRWAAVEAVSKNHGHNKIKNDYRRIAERRAQHRPRRRGVQNFSPSSTTGCATARLRPALSARQGDARTQPADRLVYRHDPRGRSIRD